VTTRELYAGIPVRRTTIKLPDDLDDRLRFEARRRGITISELTREAIAAHLGAPPRRHLRAAGAGRGDGSSVAGRIDDLLNETGFGEEAWS
jgi:predicted transcriptional regulator